MFIILWILFWEVFNVFAGIECITDEKPLYAIPFFVLALLWLCELRKEIGRH